MNELLTRIENLYKKKGWTAKRFGLEIGLKKSPMNDWRCGKATPTLEQVYKMCDIFEASANYILFGEHFPIVDKKNSFIVAEPHKSTIKKYLALNQEHQANVRGVIDMYAAEEQTSATVEKGVAG